MQAKTFNSFGDWELRKKLGAGGFGEVILWKNRITQLEIATKSLTQNEQLAADEVQKLKERWTREIEFMRNFKADYIVRALQLEDQAFMQYLNERHAWRPLPVLVMEYCNGGDLRAHLQKVQNLNGLCEFEIREVLRALRNAVDYMHNQCNIKHRDLKPDNIVIQKMPNGKRVYKLTDFGFARYINDATMLQSVVGTRNYFAPEIVDSGGYTKTVDYWSIGIMAFEMLCGVLPFIPHQSLYNKITEIRAKPNHCIAITEDFDKPNSFHCHSKIFDENRVSTVFRNEIEKWLKLCLDTNHRTRGSSMVGVAEVPNLPGGRILRFYSELDNMLNTRILRIFSLKNYAFYHYEVKEETVLTDLIRNIQRDMDIELTRQYFILPVGHPLKALKPSMTPLDFFVEEWCDTSVTTNPPAMLYIADLEDACTFQEPQISAVIRRCFIEPISNDDIDEAPTWLIQKFALDINYLLTNEQFHLAAYLDGLQQYTLNVEQPIFDFKKQITDLIYQAYMVKGMSVQFFNSLDAVLKVHSANQGYENNLLTNWQQKAEKLREDIQISLLNLIPKLQTRYDSVLRRIKELASSKFYETLVKDDIYSIAPFQSHLEASHLNYKFDELQRKQSACNKCRSFVHDVLEKRSTFFKNKTLNGIRIELAAINKEFRLIQKSTKDTWDFLTQKQKAIEIDTQNLYIDLIQNQRGQNILQSSQISMLPTTVDTTMICSNMNGFCESFDHCMDISAKDLIQEAHESMRLMSMDLDPPMEEARPINSNNKTQN